MTHYNKNINIVAIGATHNKKNIIKLLNIPAQGLFNHTQIYNTDTWSLINNQNPIEFNESYEGQEFAAPAYTSFDYSQDVLENPDGSNISNESTEIAAPTQTNFDYSQDVNGDPTDSVFPEIG
jgi:hypothetical protein